MLRLAVTLSAATATLVACGHTTGGTATVVSSPSEATQTSVSVSNSLPSPPPAPNKFNDGTTFEPCRAFTGDELTSWGVKPDTVHIDGGPDFVQRGCGWDGDGWTTYVAVLNRPVSDYLNHDTFPGSQSIQVDGLDGVAFRPRGGDVNSCWVVLPSQQAAVGTMVGILDQQRGRRAVPDTCTKVMEIATVVAGKLPQ